jgi:hypothetical protein
MHHARLKRQQVRQFARCVGAELEDTDSDGEGGEPLPAPWTLPLALVHEAYVIASAGSRNWPFPAVTPYPWHVRATLDMAGPRLTTAHMVSVIAGVTAVRATSRGMEVDVSATVLSRKRGAHLTSSTTLLYPFGSPAAGVEAAWRADGREPHLARTEYAWVGSDSAADCARTWREQANAGPRFAFASHDWHPRNLGLQLDAHAGPVAHGLWIMGRALTHLEKAGVDLAGSEPTPAELARREPGDTATWLSVRCEFPQPLFLPCKAICTHRAVPRGDRASRDPSLQTLPPFDAYEVCVIGDGADTRAGASTTAGAADSLRLFAAMHVEVHRPPPLPRTVDELRERQRAEAARNRKIRKQTLRTVRSLLQALDGDGAADADTSPN